MFEKFSEKARKAMSSARREAIKAGSEFIGTEHVLLGLLADRECGASLVLVGLADVKEIRRAIDKEVSAYKGPPTVSLGQLPFSPRAKTCLELAEEAARSVGRGDLVGTGHLLIGLVDEPKGIAHRVLAACGVTGAAVRKELALRGDVPDTGSYVEVKTRAEWTCGVCRTVGSSASVDVLPGKWRMLGVSEGRVDYQAWSGGKFSTLVLCARCSLSFDSFISGVVPAEVLADVSTPFGSVALALAALKMARSQLTERYGSDPCETIAAIDGALESLSHGKE